LPTIDQLAPATSASDADELIVSQGGIARKVTRAQILNGVQPALSVPAGMLLGGTTSSTSAPGFISVGANLILNGSTLSATATPFNPATLPSGMVPKATDSIAMAQNGTTVAVTFNQLLGGISGATNVDVSSATVRPSGSSTAQTLAAIIPSLLPISGGSLSGPLTLSGSPSASGQATNKAYVDQLIGTALPKSGGSMSGEVVLYGAPTSPNGAATKSYVDNANVLRLSLAGGSLSGALALAADPTARLQAATKQYVDARVARTGDTLTGSLTLAADPVATLHAATKHYVDASVATAVPLGGGTMAGALYLASDPTMNGQASTKQYVDQRVLRAGDTLTGALTLSGPPVQNLHAATKAYVDTQTGSAIAKSGGSMSGSLLLATDPAAALQAATKQYVDTRLYRNGDTLTGPLVLSGAPTIPLHAATKAYVDSTLPTAAYQNGGSFGGSVFLSGDPVAPLQATTKQYTDQRILRTGDTLTGSLVLSGDPTTSHQAATKGYVDGQLLTSLARSGGTMTGALLLSSDPSAALQSATKQYVDAQVSTALPVSGGSLTGILSLASLPQASFDAANKQYVDLQTGMTIARSGGTMSGPLVLAMPPTNPMHAATKSYVDANPNSQKIINVCLPPYNAKLDGVTDDTAAFKAAYSDAAAGSTIYVPNGTTVLQQPGSWGIALTKRVKWQVDGTVLTDGTPLAAAIQNGAAPASVALPGLVTGNVATGITTSQSASQSTDFAVQQSSYIVNHNGGSATVICNQRGDTIVYNSPGNFVWNGLDRLVWAGTQTPTATAPAQHVARYVQAVRQVAATNTQGQALPQPQLWASVLEYHDATGQPSSVTGASLTVEMDWFGNGLDDANCRTIQSLVVGQASLAGAPVEIASIIGVWLSAGSSGSAKAVFDVNIPFSSAVLDTTDAKQINSAPVIRMTAGQAIAFEASNSYRLAFDSTTSTLRWYSGPSNLSYVVGKGITVGWEAVFASSSTVPAYMAGNIVFLSGASAYTMTLPAASTVAAGTGYTFSVVGAGPVSILPNGHDTIDSSPVVLHLNDRYHIVSDGVSGWREVFWTNAVSPHFQGPITLPSYTVSALPTGVTAGAKAFASNGLKPSERAGAGTGVEVFFDGQRWISSCSGTAVSA
jgi:hypothetical protein